MDSSRYASLLSVSSGKPCVVYKCVADPQFDSWLATAKNQHRQTAVNLVGRASSDGEYCGPTLPEAMEQVAGTSGLDFGCVCIAERHTIEAAAARGKSYPTEHENMTRKQQCGAKWFISQAIYNPEHTVRLLKDYAARCRELGLVPRKVVLTFTPVSRPKTMDFVKWLGVSVPPEAEELILSAGSHEKDYAPRVDAANEFLCGVLKTILAETAGIGVPLGIR